MEGRPVRNVPPYPYNKGYFFDIFNVMQKW